MPIITKPSEALKLALNIFQMPQAPWSMYSTNRGCHTYTCNALDYLVEAEEIVEEARSAALAALYPKSHLAQTGMPLSLAKGAWWYIPEDDLTFGQMRINAINKTIEELEAKGE